MFVVTHLLSLADIQATALNYVLNCRKPLSELAGYDEVPQEVAVKLFEILYQKINE